jgi:multimeric flavodoxin WrbA
MAEETRLVVGINGGPRKGWNTDQLINEALKGAEDEGAETHNFDLYRLNYKGCVSCFGCKKPNTFTSGKCALSDDLSPVLTLLERATGVVMGSPIYISDITGALRSFWERYLFINIAYDSKQNCIFKKGPALAMIYTMGIGESLMEDRGYDHLFAIHRIVLKRLNSPYFEQLISYDTLQFEDYSKYHASSFDPDHKKKRHIEIFPKDLQKAYEIGRRLGQNIGSPLHFPLDSYTASPKP